MEAQYVELSLFVTVVISVITLVLGGLLYLANRVEKVKEAVSLQNSFIEGISKENEGDANNIEDLWEAIEKNTLRMDAMDRQHTQDVIRFTETVGNLNVTLGKIETTMENTNSIMNKVVEKLEDYGKDIYQLKAEKNG